LRPLASILTSGFDSVMGLFLSASDFSHFTPVTLSDYGFGIKKGGRGGTHHPNLPVT
jgi:hypothetical protein